MAGKMALRKRICFACSEQFPEVPCEPSECPIIQVIKDIDPESLRPKGRLEFKYIIDADYYNSAPAWFCTHCGWHIRDKGGKPKPPKMNYCPNCGFKIEGADICEL